MKSPRVASLFVTICLTGVVPANAASSFGTLSNFDIYNDTATVTHGFEIELAGISGADVLYQFTGNRYGTPQIVPYGGGTYVRWESPYAAGAWGAATPVAPAIVPTGGHACVQGTPGYNTSGCEHFGVSLRGNATSTTYRWLIEDPAQPGHLKPLGASVSLPAPTWAVAPQPAAPPVVQAVIPAPKPEQPEFQYGEAQWVKVFVTERSSPAELDHLVGGDPEVPDSDAEVEIEWVLLQAGDPSTDELDLFGPIAPGTEAVVRRYEFYKYLGAYDAESHEALCGNPCTPDASNRGNYIGSQIAALNLNADAAVVPEPGSWLLGATALSLLALRLRQRRSG